MAYNKTKCDPELGQRVHEHLLSIGLETPTTDLLNEDAKEKIAKIEKSMTDVMQTLGLDLSDDSLIETPKRVAKMMVLDQAWGLQAAAFPKCTTVEQKMHYDAMVKCEKIEVMSVCEHHWMTISGHATVAYIPSDKVLGLSKLNRIVEYFSRRPQIQERLTCQIHETLCFILDTKDVAVSIDAKHYCVASRGVGDATSRTSTSKLSGAFKEDEMTRAEFFAHH